VLFSNFASAMYFMYKSTYCLLARDFTIKVGSFLTLKAIVKKVAQPQTRATVSASVLGS
jgi:hypothetical protein